MLYLFLWTLFDWIKFSRFFGELGKNIVLGLARTSINEQSVPQQTLFPQWLPVCNLWCMLHNCYYFHFCKQQSNTHSMTQCQHCFPPHTPFIAVITAIHHASLHVGWRRTSGWRFALCLNGLGTEMKWNVLLFIIVWPFSNEGQPHHEYDTLLSTSILNTINVYTICTQVPKPPPSQTWKLILGHLGESFHS